MILRGQNGSALLTGTGLLLSLILSKVLGSDVTEADVVEMTDEDRLLEEMFRRRHYNPDSRPAERADDVVAVELSIMPKQLAKINDLNEIMELLVWIDMIWTDFRLRWNESDYGGLSRISVPFLKIWSPDIVLTNSAEKWNLLAELNIVVSSDGYCRWFPPMMAVSYCPIDIRWFPFDDQFCLLEFESWSYDTSKLNLTTSSTPIFGHHYRRNSEWDLLEILHEVSVIKYPCCLFPSSHLTFTFHWRRRILFYGINLILPCSLLSALSAVTFIIPPQTGERIGLGISTLLAMSVNQLIVADRVPPTSNSMPLIGIYFACTMTANALSLMAMVGISNLYHRSSTKMNPMPDWVRTIVCIRLGRLLRMPKPTQDEHGSQVIDCQKIRPNSTNQFDNGKSVTEANQQLSPSNDAADGQSPEGEDENYDDWKYAALVIDRLCFYVYVFCLTMITLSFYACAIAVRSNSTGQAEPSIFGI